MLESIKTPLIFNPLFRCSCGGLKLKGRKKHLQIGISNETTYMFDIVLISLEFGGHDLECNEFMAS